MGRSNVRAAAAAWAVVVAVVVAAAPSSVVAQGGTECAVCTALVGLFEQLAVLHPEPVIVVMENYCRTLPEPPQSACISFVNTYGELIIAGFVARNSADMICRNAGICTDPTCNLFPQPPPNVLPVDWVGRAAALANAPKFAPCDLPVISEWCRSLEDFVEIHTPLFDEDRDRHSTFPTFRGSHWRGKDCDETRNDVYPGRQSSVYGPDVDHNCNGIAGVDEQGISYEEKFCGNSSSIGLIFLGDSATAHFSVPPNYVNASAINNSTYDQLLFIASNELDWPQQSGSTGFLKEANKDCPGPIDSIYLRMRERNRCNHRDFQNIGVNGARVGSMEKIVTGMDRNVTYDKPAILVYGLIGNDVCNSNPTTERMTTPQDFKQRVLNSLAYIEQTVPFGSHVLFVGLVDGRVLWDIMNAEIHRVGEVDRGAAAIGVTYAAFYDFLNCLEISPCASWLNSNETYRDGASARAVELNQQYVDIINEYTYTKFDMAYFDYPIFEVIDYWVGQGGNPKDLVELADGFHPSQLGNALGTKFFFERMEAELPSWIGPVNPFNAEIDAIFGELGGH